MGKIQIKEEKIDVLIGGTAVKFCRRQNRNIYIIKKDDK